MTYRFHARYTNQSGSPQSGHNDIYPQYYIWSNTYFISHQKMSLVFFRLSSFLYLIYAKCLADDLFRFQVLNTDFQRSLGAIHHHGVNLIKCGLVCSCNYECSSINYNNVTKVCEINMQKMKSQEYRIHKDAGFKFYDKVCYNYS